MLLSVIIPTCNRNELLEKCLKLLDPKNQTINLNNYEEIISDDSKKNVAKKLIEEKYKWAKWVEGFKKGPAANRNNGAKHARGEWFIFIDDDCLPDRHLLQLYKSAIEKYRETLAFEGCVLPNDWNLLKKDLAECPVNTNGNCFWSANICIKKSLFEEINGFNEEYLIAAQEDQQMKIDIENATKKQIRFLKECIVIHPVRFPTLYAQLKRIPAASKNYSIYAVKNKNVLSYQTVWKFMEEQTKFHARSAFHCIKAGKIKSFIVSCMWLCYGVPLNVINFSRVSRKIDCSVQKGYL